MENNFIKKGWCKINSSKINEIIENLIDEIIEFSHLFFEKKTPEIHGLKNKSEYLATTINTFSSIDRDKISFIYDGIKI